MISFIHAFERFVVALSCWNMFLTWLIAIKECNGIIRYPISEICYSPTKLFANRKCLYDAMTVILDSWLKDLIGYHSCSCLTMFHDKKVPWLHKHNTETRKEIHNPCYILSLVVLTEAALTSWNKSIGNWNNQTEFSIRYLWHNVTIPLNRSVFQFVLEDTWAQCTPIE